MVVVKALVAIAVVVLPSLMVFVVLFSSSSLSLSSSSSSSSLLSLSSSSSSSSLLLSLSSLLSSESDVPVSDGVSFPLSSFLVVTEVVVVMIVSNDLASESAKACASSTERRLDIVDLCPNNSCCS